MLEEILLNLYLFSINPSWYCFVQLSDIELKKEKEEKQMIDALRSRNGNLAISSVLQRDDASEL